MDLPENNGITYYLPLDISSAFSPLHHILQIVFAAALFSVPWILKAPLWTSILCAILGAAVVGFYLYIAVLHRCQLRVNKGYLYVHLPFYTCILRLVEIDAIEIKHARFCPTISIRTLLKKKYRLPLFLFYGVDAQMLKTTIDTEIARAIAALPEPEENAILDAEDLKYPLPFKVRSKMTFGQHILYLFSSVILFLFSLLCLFYLTKIFWYAFFFLPFSILLFMVWLYYGALQKGYVYGDAQGIRLKRFAAREKIIPWENIAMVDFVGVDRYGLICSGNTHLRIVTFSKENTVNAKQFFFRRNPDLHLIPLSMFAALNRYRFMRTVRDSMDAVSASVRNGSDTKCD